MTIRPETPSDWNEIAVLNGRAFEDVSEGSYEAELVSRLRKDGLVAASLVAEIDGRVAGHILLSWIDVEVAGRRVPSLALAPMSVAPELQRSGIGSRLVRAAIEAARGAGAEAIIVLGYPRFYSRFGFSAAAASRLACPFAGDAFMALELAPGCLAGVGSVTYPQAFGVENAHSTV